jgi:hypothetical protein
MRINELVEKATNEIQDKLSQVENEDDLENLSEAFDEIGQIVDRYAAQFSNAHKALNGEQGDREQDMERALDPQQQKSAQRQTTGSKR